MGIRMLILFVLLSSLSWIHPGAAHALTAHTVTSPNGLISLTVTDQADGSLTYQVTAGSQTILGQSPLGIATSAVDLTTGLSFVSQNQVTIDETYSLPAGTKPSYRNHANELTLTYSKGGSTLELRVRAYDDGVAYQYRLPGSGSVTISGESSGFRLPTNTGGWAASWRTDYEGDYVYHSPSELNGADYTLPVLASINNNAYFALLTEAGVYNKNASYAPSLASGSGDGSGLLKVGRTPDQAFPMSSTLPFESPWRVVVVAGDLNTLVNSDLVQNLNPATTATDTSWVAPGRAAWSWYVDESSASSIAKQKAYVDFAESMGFEYVTVDCCYNKPDLATIASYAAQHGVKIFAWVTADSINTPSTADAEMQLLKSYGVVGLKVDFFLKDSQAVIGWYQTIAEAAQRNQMMVNFHGATKPGGENRVWPWVVTSEAVRGIEHYKYPPPPSARLNVTLPFIRNPLGGMDYTPTVLSENSATTTQGQALAEAVVFTSAMQHYSDSAAAYSQWVGRHLMRVLPTTWDETKVLEGFPGNYITEARRKGSAWFIGAMTDQARTAQVPLTFLGAGSYTATIFADGSNGRLTVSTQTVTNSTTLSLPLLATGGAAVHIAANPLPQIGAADTRYEAESPTNTLTGTASPSVCAACSGGTKIGNLDTTSAIQFNGVQASSAGTYNLELNYIAGDARPVQIQVNGTVATTLTVDTTGGWSRVGQLSVPVTLRAGSNTIRLANPSGWAPDIDSLTISRTYEAEASANTRTGTASIASCSDCSNGQKVGNLGQGSTLTFNGVTATTAGNKTIRIAYTSADPRTAYVSVNGGTSTPIDFHSTTSWDKTGTATIGLSLSAGTNTITFSNPSGWAPDIDNISVRE
jgi:alpha-glucosidase